MSKTLTFKVGRTISASSDAIWQVLGDFGTEHSWTKTLDRCTRDTAIARVGTVRSCTLPKPLMGRTLVREEAEYLRRAPSNLDRTSLLPDQKSPPIYYG
jgi:hypothetical protein